MAAEAMVSNMPLHTAAAVLSWFILNIAMASSTKWIFLYGNICREDVPTQCVAFQFPLTITVIHMVFSWGMCHIQLHYFRGGQKKQYLTLKQQFEKVAPLAICFSLSVAMGNLSLKYIFPSFNQMLGAMSPLITVGLAVAMQSKRYNSWTWLSMPIICGGLAVCSVQEMNFSARGALHATGATVLRALKSIMQGKLLQGDHLDSVTLLYYMAPWAAANLFVLACLIEGFEPELLLLRGLWGSQSGHRVTGGSTVLVLLIVSGLNACLLNVANFLVTSYTSPVTLQVLGNVKSCLSIIVSVSIFRNHLNAEQAFGVAACLFGVWVYNRKGGAVSPEPTKGSSKTKARQVELIGGTAFNGSPEGSPVSRTLSNGRSCAPSGTAGGRTRGCLGEGLDGAG